MIGMVQVVPEQKVSWTELSANPPAPTGMSLVVLSEARWTW
jgi:hypothetical protein